MATVTHTFLDGAGSPLVDEHILFRRLDPAQLTPAGESIPGGAYATAITDADGEISVVLGAGFWLVTWSVGPAVSRHIIDVPTGSGTHAMADLMSGTEIPGRVVPIRWGTSASGTLDGAGILALANTLSRASIAGEYSFAAGGYKFLAWPDGARPPVPETGIWDTGTDLPAIMAGADEGFPEEDNGWSYRLVNVSGRAWRLYRTRQSLGDTITLRIS